MSMTNIFKNRFLRFGIPFISLIVGGSFGLKYFAELRYRVKKDKFLSKEEAAKFGVEIKGEDEKLTLEQEYERLKQMDIDTWSNIRGPRPWEDSKTVQQEIRETHVKPQ